MGMHYRCDGSVLVYSWSDDSYSQGRGESPCPALRGRACSDPKCPNKKEKLTIPEIDRTWQGVGDAPNAMSPPPRCSCNPAMPGEHSDDCAKETHYNKGVTRSMNVQAPKDPKITVSIPIKVGGYTGQRDAWEEHTYEFSVKIVDDDLVLETSGSFKRKITVPWSTLQAAVLLTRPALKPTTVYRNVGKDCFGGS